MEQVKAKNEETMKNEEEKQGAKRMGQPQLQERKGQPPLTKGKANPAPRRKGQPQPEGSNPVFFLPSSEIILL